MTGMSSQIYAKGGNDELVRHFQRQDVQFLVVGGAAVAVHGCRDPVDVDDLDLLIDPTIENAQRAIAALTAAGFAISFGPESLAKPSIQISLKALHYWADLLTPDQTVNFAALQCRSVPARISYLEVNVIGQADLIEMKARAVQPGSADVAKHERDLACLKSG